MISIHEIIIFLSSYITNLVIVEMSLYDFVSPDHLFQKMGKNRIG